MGQNRSNGKKKKKKGRRKKLREALKQATDASSRTTVAAAPPTASEKPKETVALSDTKSKKGKKNKKGAKRKRSRKQGRKSEMERGGKRHKAIEAPAGNDGDDEDSLSEGGLLFGSMGGLGGGSGGSKRKKKAESKLMKGSRFRWLNERLYTTTSEEAFELFSGTPELFDEYHAGFRDQVRSWPVNPVDVIIEHLEEMPKTWKVADFGCGEAKLSASVPQETFSFDLVAPNERVTACDMRHVPLESGTVDVAVFCLSLMGTNLVDFIKEARRVLTIRNGGGLLRIAEVRSRLGSAKAEERFAQAIQGLGFDLEETYGNDVFVFYDFQKNKRSIGRKEEARARKTLSLAPCMYKKR